MTIKYIFIAFQTWSKKVIEIGRTSKYIASFLIVVFCISVLMSFVDATFNSLLVLLLDITSTGNFFGSCLKYTSTIERAFATSKYEDTCANIQNVCSGNTSSNGYEVRKSITKQNYNILILQWWWTFLIYEVFLWYV